METDIEFKFSKFSYDKPKCLYLKNIFDKYNLFKIKINNPLIKYIKGLRIIYDSISLNMLLKEKPLEKNDFRYFREAIADTHWPNQVSYVFRIVGNKL